MPTKPDQFQIPEFARTDLPPAIKFASIAGLVAVLAITAISSMMVAANTTVSTPETPEETAIVEEVEPEVTPSPEASPIAPEATISPAPTPSTPAPVSSISPVPTPEVTPTTAATETPGTVETPSAEMPTPGTEATAPTPAATPETPAASPEPTSEPGASATEITDAAQISTLQQKLQEQVDQAWQTPVPADLEYKVTLDETGAIAKYTATNPAAQEYGEQIPLATLVKADSPAAGEMPKAPFAEFKVTFTADGNLVIQPE